MSVVVADSDRLELRFESQKAKLGDNCGPRPLIPWTANRAGLLGDLLDEIERADNGEAPGVLVDAAQDATQSLVDVEGFRLMAEGLDTLGVFGAYLTDNTFGQSVNALMASMGVDREAVERVAAETMLDPYCAFAVGIGRDGSEAFMGLVLLYQSESQVDQNVERLRERLSEGTSAASGKAWSELFSTEKLEVEVSGRTLLARVPVDPPSVWLRWALLRDPLLLHEDLGPCP